MERFLYGTESEVADLRQRSLSPNNAIAVLDDRVKLIGRINLDIADWLAVWFANAGVSNC